MIAVRATRFWLPIAVVAASAVIVVFLQFRKAGGVPPGPLGGAHVADMPCVDCGPKALFVALNRLGLPVSQAALTNELAPDDTGVSFDALLAAARRHDSAARLQTVSLADLQKFDGTAVLWINGNHYVAVDPRESAVEGRSDEALRIYDTDTAAMWWSPSQLSAAWTGEALLIPRGKSEGGLLSWQTCFQDAGTVNSKTPLVFKFHYANLSNEAVPIEVLKVGCSCSTPAISDQPTPSKKDGDVSVKVVLDGKRGYFQSYVVVGVGDKRVPVVLTLQGTVENNIRTSVEKLYLGEVAKGERAQASFFVYGANGNKLELYSAEAEFDLPASKELHTSARFAELKTSDLAGGSRERNRLHLTPGDFRVDVQVSPTLAATAGSYSGRMIVRGNLPEGQVVVPFEVVVRSGVRIEPSALLLSVRENSGTEAKLAVTQTSGLPVNIETVSILGTDLLIRGLPVVSSNGDVTTVTAQIGLSQSQAKQATGELLLRLTDGSTVSAPLVVIRSP